MSVIFYLCDEKQYYSLYNWSTWQKIDKPTSSKRPEFNENEENIRRIFDKGSSKSSRTFSPNKNKNKNKNKNRIEQEEKRKRIVEVYSL